MYSPRHFLNQGITFLLFSVSLMLINVHVFHSSCFVDDDIDVHQLSLFQTLLFLLLLMCVHLSYFQKHSKSVLVFFSEWISIFFNRKPLLYSIQSTFQILFQNKHYFFIFWNMFCDLGYSGFSPCSPNKCSIPYKENICQTLF